MHCIGDASEIGRLWRAAATEADDRKIEMD